MLGITVVCVGSLREKYLEAGMAEYAKRLGGLCKFQVIEVASSPLNEKNAGQKEIQDALAAEEVRLLKAIPKGALQVALCVGGKRMSSEQLAQTLQNAAGQGNSQVAFLIGSSHGLSKGVENAADLRLSLSDMTFPHQLARLLITEQIYRACMINAGRSYHK